MKKEIMEEMLRHEITTCPECGCKRALAGIFDLPTEFFRGAKEIEKQTGMKIDYYLYCPCCDKHSMIFCSQRSTYI